MNLNPKPYTNIRTYSDFFRPCQVCYFLLCFGYISTQKKKKGTPFQPHFSLVSMIPYPLGITRKKIKNKIKIGVGLFPTYYGKGRGSLLPGATHCTVLHCTCIKETENRHQNKRKTTKLKLIAATSCCSFQSISYNTAIFLPTWVSTEKNRFLQLPGSVPLYLHIWHQLNY